MVVLQCDLRRMSRFRDGIGNVGGYLRDIDDVTIGMDMSDFCLETVFEVYL